MIVFVQQDNKQLELNNKSSFAPKQFTVKDLKSLVENQYKLKVIKITIDQQELNDKEVVAQNVPFQIRFVPLKQKVTIFLGAMFDSLINPKPLQQLNSNIDQAIQIKKNNEQVNGSKIINKKKITSQTKKIKDKSIDGFSRIEDLNINNEQNNSIDDVLKQIQDTDKNKQIQQYQKKKQFLEQQLKDLEQNMKKIESQKGKLNNIKNPPRKLQEICQDEEANKKAVELVKKLRIQKLEIERKKDKEQKEYADKIYIQEKIRKEENELQIQMLREQKRKEIEQRLQEEKKKKEEINIIAEQQKQLVKELLKNKSEVKSQENEKEINANKPPKNRRIDLEEIKEHRKKCEQDLYLRKLEKEREKIEQSIMNEDKISKIHKSVFTRKVVEEDLQIKKKDEILLIEKKKKLQRQKMYGEVVKDMFMPTFETIPNVKPTQQRTQIKSQSPMRRINVEDYKKLQKALDEPIESKVEVDTELPYIRAAQRLKEQKQKEKEREQKLREEKEVQRLEEQQKLKQIQSQKNNYLLEIRNVRLLKEKNDEEPWKRNLKDQRLENVIQNMQKIESDALIKEKLGRERKDIKLEEQANEMILHSIKAKLALLQNMRQQ